MARAGSRGLRRGMEQRWADELMSLCTCLGLGSSAGEHDKGLLACMLISQGFHRHFSTVGLGVGLVRLGAVMLGASKRPPVADVIILPEKPSSLVRL